jgi:outer membrane protein
VFKTLGYLKRNIIFVKIFLLKTMKTKASIFTTVTLGVLLATSIVACNNKTDDKKATTATPAVATAEKIVYINQDTLLAKYEYVKDMNKRLNDKGKSAQGDLDSKKQAFQREVAEYQKGQSTLSADQRASTEQRLQRKGQELQGYEQNATAQFQDEQAAEGNKLFDRYAEFVKKFAKDHGYKLVLSYSKANPVVMYGDPSLDVTAEVVKGLNEAYTKDKK